MSCRHLPPLIRLSVVSMLAVFSTSALAKPGNDKGGGSGSGSSEPDPGATPFVAFAADRTQVELGGSVRLSWASSNARHCFASGDWEGKVGLEGTYLTPALDGAKSYSLQCKDGGKAATATVAVAVTSAEVPSEPEPEPEPEPGPEPAPTVDLMVAAATVASGGFAQISWTSTDADTCSAHGGWSGVLSPIGSRSIGPISSSTSFGLSCTGSGGSVNDSVTVNVAPQPSLDLATTAEVVARGESPQLRWSSTDASRCTASGGWSGDKPLDGQETVRPIEQRTTYTLSCTGIGGSALALISVAINDAVALSWEAPTQNEDGSRLTDLAGFRIYYGLTSRSYSEVLEVTSAQASSQSLTLPSGSYYFAMTALDAEGNESAHSNEVSKIIN